MAHPLLRGPVATLLALALAGAWAEDAPVGDPLVTTTWEVRKEAQEVIADLRGSRADVPTLLERVRTLLAGHGDSLIARDGTFAPISEIFFDELRQAGLDDEYIATYGPLALRRLDELRRAGAEEAEWHRFARSFPGTDAALQAWKVLADRAWDTGRLGAYIAAAQPAGEAKDPKLSKRLEAARSLVTDLPAVRLPTSLELEEMWRLDLPAAEVRATPMRRGTPRQISRSFVLSSPVDDLAAASDGVSFFIFDHLVGRRVGDMQAIGVNPLPTPTCRPAAGPLGFVALGLDSSNTPMLTSLDRNGVLRWKISLTSETTWGGLSAPVIIDDLVVVAALQMKAEGPELWVFALSLADGSHAWESFVAKLPVMLGRAMFWDDGGSTPGPPIVALHRGGILIMSNTGLLARVNTLGVTERIWTYPTANGGMENGMGHRRDTARTGGLASDGRWAMATPADADGFALVLGPNEVEPVRYTGDGCRGNIVDLREGAALLAGKQTTLVACQDLTPIWHRTTTVESPSGLIGTDHVLVAGKERLTLLTRTTGEMVSDRGSDPPISLSAGEGMMIVGGREALVAYGNAEAFIAEQIDRAAKDPTDYRPLVALGKVWAAQGKTRKAYDQILLGLGRGAPAEYAILAARLLRQELEVSLDDPLRFAEAESRLTKLLPFAKELATETLYWQARRAEQSQKPKVANEKYRELLTKPPVLVSFGQSRDAQIEASLIALAQAGLARLGGGESPAWQKPIVVMDGVPLTTPWQVNASRGRSSLITGNMIIGYEGGLLVARNLSAGGPAWHRLPDSRLLGVKQTAAEITEVGVQVEVLDGTAAAAAGMRTGDIITAFNDRPIRDFHRDLIPAVADSEPGSPFRLSILRDRKAINLEGTLGGELVEAFDADGSTVLVWPVFPVRGPRGQGEGMWVAALDVATGRELWRGTIPPATVERMAPRPVLVQGGLVVSLDGADLIGIEVRDAGGPKERWRLPGEAAGLDNAIPVGANAVLLADAARARIRLLDTTHGTVLFSLPADPDGRAVLDGTDLFVRSVGGNLACWDLGLGRLRWTTTQPCLRPVAAAGDAVFALNDRKQMVMIERANGEIRRTYGDWASIDDSAVVDGRIYLNTRRSETGRAVAALALPGGAVLWERPLPRNSEVREFHAGRSGVAVVLAEPSQQPSLLSLSGSGDIAVARRIQDGESILPIPGGLVVSGPQSLAAMIGETIPPPPSVPTTIAVPGPSLLATARAALPNLIWQSMGDAAFAVAHCERGILVFGRLPEGVEVLELRIGDEGPAIDVANQAVVFQRHRVPRFTDTADGWREGEKAKLPAEGTVWLAVQRLDPPVARAPGTRILVRASTSIPEEATLAPWWLRRSWRLIEAALPVPAPAPNQP